MWYTCDVFGQFWILWRHVKIKKIRWLKCLIFLCFGVKLCKTLKSDGQENKISTCIKKNSFWVKYATCIFFQKRMNFYKILIFATLMTIFNKSSKGVYMVYILNRPLFFGDLKNFPETKNNSRFYILKLYFLLHYNQFYCSVNSLLNIALQSWCILFKIRKIDVFLPNRCFLLLS